MLCFIFRGFIYLWCFYSSWELIFLWNWLSTSTEPNSRVEKRSLPPQHIINSHITRTICVQAGELRHSRGNWRGRRTVERQKEGFLLMVNCIFFKYPDKPPHWNLKLAEGACFAEHSPLFAVLSSLFSSLILLILRAFQQTALLLQWMVSQMCHFIRFCP